MLHAGTDLCHFYRDPEGHRQSVLWEWVFNEYGELQGGELKLAQFLNTLIQQIWVPRDRTGDPTRNEIVKLLTASMK